MTQNHDISYCNNKEKIINNNNKISACIIKKKVTIYVKKNSKFHVQCSSPKIYKHTYTYTCLIKFKITKKIKETRNLCYIKPFKFFSFKLLLLLILILLFIR